MKQAFFILVLLSSTSATLNAQDGVPMGGCKTWVDGRWVEVPCGGSGSSSGSSGEYHGVTLQGLLNSAKESKAAKADKLQQQLFDEASAANSKGVEYSKQGDWVNALTYFQIAVDKNPGDEIIRQNLAQAQARVANDRGQAFVAKGDWANAVIAFQEAVNRNPFENNRPVYQGNLDYARMQLNAEAENLRKQQQNEAAAKGMQQSIINYANTLNAAPVSSGGLDFDGGNSGNTATSGGNGNKPPITRADSAHSKTAATTGLQFGDPNVVDTRVPSGLSKATDNAISVVYKNAPPGVSERVRKGFLAVDTKDWKVAKAWFEDALRFDPGNKDLQTLILLCDYTPVKDQKTNEPKNLLEEIQKKLRTQTPDPYYAMNQTKQREIDAFFKQVHEGKSSVQPSAEVQKYLDTISLWDFHKHIDFFNHDHLQLPSDNDVLFLFPGN